MKLFDATLGHLEHALDTRLLRQNTLAGNIANADTPGYQPRDLTPFLSQLTRTQIGLATTDPQHLSPAPDPLHLLAQPKPRERALDGNAVSLESELTKVADTETAQQLTSQLYTSYVGMFRTALGKGG